jgi:hypothetical protein
MSRFVIALVCIVWPLSGCVPNSQTAGEKLNFQSEDLTHERFLVIYGFGYMGGKAQWQLRILTDGSIWENSRKLSDDQIRQTFLLFREEPCSDIVLNIMGDEEHMRVATLTNAVARFERIATQVLSEKNSIHLYIHSSALTHLTGVAGY